jgi:hypothetical protein
MSKSSKPTFTAKDVILPKGSKHARDSKESEDEPAAKESKMSEHFEVAAVEKYPLYSEKPWNWNHLNAIPIDIKKVRTAELKDAKTAEQLKDVIKYMQLVPAKLLPFGKKGSHYPWFPGNRCENSLLNKTCNPKCCCDKNGVFQCIVAVRDKTTCSGLQMMKPKGSFQPACQISVWLNKNASDVSPEDEVFNADTGLLPRRLHACFATCHGAFVNTGAVKNGYDYAQTFDDRCEVARTLFVPDRENQKLGKFYEPPSTYQKNGETKEGSSSIKCKPTYWRDTKRPDIVIRTYDKKGIVYSHPEMPSMVLGQIPAEDKLSQEQLGDIAKAKAILAKLPDPFTLIPKISNVTVYMSLYGVQMEGAEWGWNSKCLAITLLRLASKRTLDTKAMEDDPDLIAAREEYEKLTESANPAPAVEQSTFYDDAGVSDEQLAEEASKYDEASAE